MSNALLLTLFTTIIGAIFIIIQFHELLAAQSAFTSPVDGQRWPDPDYQGDLDPWSSTALEDYQNTTFLEQGLVERGFQDYLYGNKQKPTPKVKDINPNRKKPTPKVENINLNRPLREAPSSPVTVELVRQRQTWLAQISVGTPPQHLFVVVEPGLNDSWVYTANHKYRISPKYDPMKSTTADNTKSSPFKFSYRNVKISGKARRDTVTLGTDVVLMQYFGSTTQVAIEGFFGGTLGLGYAAKSDVLKQPSLLFNAVSEKVISEPIFAFDLSTDESELHLGGVNKDYYKGDIQYHPVSLKGSMYWFNQANGQINVNEKMLTGIKAAVDIRTYRIKGPQNEVEAVYKAMKAEYQKMGNLYVFLCDKMPRVGFQWGNREWEISPNNFKLARLAGTMWCAGIIQADPTLSKREWILGARFMMGVYTVYDLKTPTRIGFGEFPPPEPKHIK